MGFRYLEQVPIIGLVFAWKLLQNEGGNRVLDLNANGVPPFPSVYYIVKLYPSLACEGIDLILWFGQLAVFILTSFGARGRWASAKGFCRD